MQRLKRFLERYNWYRLARDIHWAAQAIYKNRYKSSSRYRVDQFQPAQKSRGNILLSYFNTIGRDHTPAREFLSDSGPDLPVFHNEWESLEIARTFLDMGYSVDLISWRNDRFIPEKNYAAFIDVRYNLERLGPLLNRGCIKIQHIDASHMLFGNYAEARRLLDLQQRRGVTLPPRRTEDPNLAIEHADCATILGNDYTVNTFRYANKPLYRLPVTNGILYPSPEGKDFDACRRHFLWLGSGGLVRKGLDLVLDAFAQMPEYHLTVCGPIHEEPDFERAYERELYSTSNIKTIGWVDIAGPEFLNIANRCVALIYPSSAEGQVGAAVTCLHAGLIPILSYESGVDVNDFGVILQDCSLERIQATIRMLADLPASTIKLKAISAWRHARAFHTRERFRVEYRKAIEDILAAHGRA